jgi:hypothetical protein
VSARFPECKSCYFNNREPAICEECENASNFEQADLDQDGLDDLRDITFFEMDPDWKNAA